MFFAIPKSDSELSIKENIVDFNNKQMLRLYVVSCPLVYVFTLFYYIVIITIHHKFAAVISYNPYTTVYN